MSLKKTFVILCLFILTGSYGQSVKSGDIIASGAIGVPHLFKTATKLIVKQEIFKENFGKYIEVSSIRGLNPISLRGEYGITEYFGLGVNVAFWNLKFEVRDYYNAQNQNFGTFVKDSVDIYKFNISSRSIGIRPNLHIPINARNHDVYVGLGFGLTSNKLNISFESTDAGRTFQLFGKNLEYDLSLPGGLYFAPTLGYRAYFAEAIGMNFEVGYEKGALLLIGLQARINHKKQK